MLRQFSATVEQLIRDNLAYGNYASEDELLLDALQSLEARRDPDFATPVGVRVGRGDQDFGFDADGVSDTCDVPSQA